MGVVVAVFSECVCVRQTRFFGLLRAWYSSRRNNAYMSRLVAAITRRTRARDCAQPLGAPPLSLCVCVYLSVCLSVCECSACVLPSGARQLERWWQWTEFATNNTTATSATSQCLYVSLYVCIYIYFLCICGCLCQLSCVCWIYWKEPQRASESKRDYCSLVDNEHGAYV